jgi:cell division protein FtsZ
MEGNNMSSNSISSTFWFDQEGTGNAAVLRVVGVGGGGGNAVNNMVNQSIKGIEFIAVNTDAQALSNNLANIKVQAGKKLTRGLGAGARPDTGSKAVEECLDEIKGHLQGTDMLFITAGMGGGTGTGGAPMIAQAAREMGILTVAIVTKPFSFEGKKRMQMAMAGIELLKQFVDTLIIIPNDRVVDVIESNATAEQALAKVDEVLQHATRGISELITEHGLINLDFADVRTTMKDGGNALIGASIASGEKRAEKAASAAITSPLLDGMTIRGAQNVLVNITASSSLTMKEIKTASEIIRAAVGDTAGEDEIILGTVINPAMGDELQITVVATRFQEASPATKQVSEASLPTVEVPISAPVVAQEPVYAPQRAPKVLVIPPYKGEENLKKLDVPTFMRQDDTPHLHVRTDSPDPARHPNVKILKVDQPKRDDAPSVGGDGNDEDAPTFFRRFRQSYS